MIGGVCNWNLCCFSPAVIFWFTLMILSGLGCGALLVLLVRTIYERWRKEVMDE